MSEKSNLKLLFFVLFCFCFKTFAIKCKCKFSENLRFFFVTFFFSAENERMNELIKVCLDGVFIPCNVFTCMPGESYHR